MTASGTLLMPKMLVPDPSNLSRRPRPRCLRWNRIQHLGAHRPLPHRLLNLALNVRRHASSRSLRLSCPLKRHDGAAFTLSAHGPGSRHHANPLRLGIFSFPLPADTAFPVNERQNRQPPRGPVVINEFVAFGQPGPMKASLDPPSFPIATSRCCGFRQTLAPSAVHIGRSARFAPEHRAPARQIRHSAPCLLERWPNLMSACIVGILNGGRGKDSFRGERKRRSSSPAERAARLIHKKPRFCPKIAARPLPPPPPLRPRRLRR